MLTFIPRTVYLIYYLLKTDFSLLFRFIRHTKHRFAFGLRDQGLSIVKDSYQYKISFLEWFQFDFAKLQDEKKKAWAGTGAMYEFQLWANPKSEREILSDKRKFYKAYKEFCIHKLWAISELETNPALVSALLKEHKQLVFKNSHSNCGRSVKFVETRELNSDSLIPWMKANGFDMVESYIKQHPEMQRLSPSGVNTVRIFTLLDQQGDCQILGCRLRISVNSPVDNLAAGNLAAPIDEDTGVVSGPGVYSDITKPDEPVHPITGVPIEGFQVPFWEDTLEMVRKASLKHPQNRSVGWDIAITAHGPDLIEGNHDWCKLVWQLPVKQGLKPLLHRHGWNE
jgi:hypothetical protein